MLNEIVCCTSYYTETIHSPARTSIKPYIALTTNLNIALNPSIQPSNSLEVSTFLRERLLRHAEVGANSESMFSVRVQASLISLVSIEEDLFNVRPVLRRAALVQIAEREPPIPQPECWRDER